MVSDVIRTMLKVNNIIQYAPQLFAQLSSLNNREAAPWLHSQECKRLLPLSHTLVVPYRWLDQARQIILFLPLLLWEYIHGDHRSPADDLIRLQPFLLWLLLFYPLRLNRF